MYIHHSIVHSSKDMKSSKCPSTVHWTKKMLHIYSMKYYTVIKRNKIMSCATPWVEPVANILREIIQERKIKYCMFSHAVGAKH